MAVEVELPRRLLTRLGDRAVVSPQNPVVIRPRSEPQPDLVLFRRHDGPLRFVKARLYARAGIPEFWLCLARDGAVEVHRAPGADGYASVTVHGPGQMVATRLPGGQLCSERLLRLTQLAR